MSLRDDLHFSPRLRLPALWQAYLALGALVTGLYAFVPPIQRHGLVMPALCLSPVVAIRVRLRHHRPASPAPWLLPPSTCACSASPTSTAQPLSPPAVRGG